MSVIQDRSDIIEKLAKKYKLPPHVVENMVKSQFKFITSVMQKKENKSMYIPGFGKFTVRKKWLQNSQTSTP